MCAPGVEIGKSEQVDRVFDAVSAAFLLKNACKRMIGWGEAILKCNLTFNKMQVVRMKNEWNNLLNKILNIH